DRRELSFAVVQIKNVWLAQFKHRSIDDPDALGVTSADYRLAVEVGNVERAATAQNRGRTVIGDVKVQRPIAINIGQRHGRAAQLGNQPRGGRGIRKMTVAVIQEAGIRPSHRGDQQIQITVSVYVGKDRARGSLIRAGHACFFGDVLELPVAEVFVERVRSV